jgi:hypothetical protein
VSPIGTPVARMHLVAWTDSCICEKLDGCGGIENPEVTCPEHGLEVSTVPFHSHHLQAPGMAVGTLQL